jgi:hypothetical protein
VTITTAPTTQTYHVFIRATPQQIWDGETVLDARPPHRLVVGYRALYKPDLATEPRSRVSWQIAMPNCCMSTMVGRTRWAVRVSRAW